MFRMDKVEIIMSFPHYSYPTYLLFNLVTDILFGGCRSFRADAAACLARLIPPLRVSGEENIPSSGRPCLLTFNHYFRPGFNAWWIALAVASQLPMGAHFVMTDELTFPGKWYAPVGMSLSRWVLRRGAKVYGFTSMPPMPPREKDVAARAHAVRAVLSFVGQTQNPVICLAPEGGDMPGGRLAYPPAGAGRFMLQLAGKGLKVVPVGVWEQDGCLCVKFGPAYALADPGGRSAEEKDRAAAKTVMEYIALLLPSHLRGEFQ
jgi:1-acyl-sn-glycerol-3-phosphate acyltransferase